MSQKLVNKQKMARVNNATLIIIHASKPSVKRILGKARVSYVLSPSRESHDVRRSSAGKVASPSTFFKESFPELS